MMQSLIRLSKLVASVRDSVRERGRFAPADKFPQQLTYLQSITASLSQALTPAQVARIIFEQGRNALNATSGVMVELIENDTLLHMMYSVGYSEEESSRFRRFPVNTPILITTAIRLKESIWIEEEGELAKRFPDVKVPPTAVPRVAWAAVPLIVEGRVLGAIGFNFEKHHHFSQNEKAFIQSLASYGAQALDRARLYEAERDARERAERSSYKLAQMQTVTAALSQALTMQDVAKVIFDEGVEVFQATGGVMLELVDDDTALNILYSVGYTDDEVKRFNRVPLSMLPLAEEIIRRKEPLWIESPDDLLKYPHIKIPPLNPPRAAWAAIPLILEGRVIGAMNFNFVKPHQFSENDRAFMTLLASYGAQALERARLYETERSARLLAERSTQQISQLQQVTAALSQALTPEHVARVIFEFSQNALQITGGTMFELVNEDSTLKILYGIGYTDEEMNRFALTPLTTASPITEVVRSKQAVWITSREDFFTRYPNIQLPANIVKRAAMAAIPLIIEGHVVGVIAFSYESSHEISENARLFMLSLADYGAQALDRARLYTAERNARELAERTTQQIAQLQQVTAALSQALTPQEVARVTFDYAVKFLDVISGIMFELVDHGETLKILHGIGYEVGEMERFNLIPLGTDLPITEAVRNKEAIWVESLDEMHTRYPHLQLPRTVRSRAAFAAIPLIVEGQVVGAISISYASTQRFLENDRAFILSLLRYGAQALDRARLFAAERESRVLSEHAMVRTIRLQSVTAALSQALTPQEVARVIIDEGMNALDAAAGAVWLLTEDRLALELAYTVGHIAAQVDAFRYAELDQPMPITDTIKSGKMMWLESRENYLSHYPHIPPDNRHHAWVLIPLFIQNQTVGCAAYSFAEPRHFPESEREFIATVVQQGSQALDRAALYEAQERATLEAQTAIRNREEFLSVAAHELKTPVTSLQGFTQLLLRGYSKTGAFDVERLEQALRQIGYQTNRLTRLVSQLLDISRIESGRLSLERQPTDLIPLIWRIISAMQATTTHHPISLDGPDSLIATVDPLRLEQVITNLADNAVKYSPDGGPVRIEIGTELADQEGSQGERQNMPMVRIAVIDHGIGIPFEARKAIFERFYQAHKERKLGGLGMGLYISIQIVYLHGGTISVDENPEGGSRFTVLLPLS